MHFNFETLCSALTAKVNFAYASHAGGDASRALPDKRRYAAGAASTANAPPPSKFKVDLL